MEIKDYVSVFTAMFTILNPIGNVAVFSTLVKGLPRTRQKQIATQSAIAIAIILIGTIWIGELVLEFFDVTISGLQVAGGIMIGSIALSMLNGKQSSIHSTNNGGKEDSANSNIGIIPIAMPIVAGPGAIVTLIVNTHSYSGFEANIGLSIIMIALALMMWICFSASSTISKKIGNTGMNIISKFMGMILLAIAATMLINGVMGLIK